MGEDRQGSFKTRIRDAILIARAATHSCEGLQSARDWNSRAMLVLFLITKVLLIGIFGPVGEALDACATPTLGGTSSSNQRCFYNTTKLPC